MGPPLPSKVSKISRFIQRRLDRAQNTSLSTSGLPFAYPPTPPETGTLNQAQDATLLRRGAPALPEANAKDRLRETLSVVGPGDQSQDSILSTSSPSSQQPTSFPQSSSKLKKTWSVAWNTLETALRLLEKSANALPPLQSAVGGLVACLDLTRAVGENRDEYENLATELTNMANTLAPYMTSLIPKDVGSSVTLIIKSIEAELAHIRQQQARHKITRTIEANQDQDDVIQRYRRIEALFRQLQNNVSLRAWEDTKKLREISLLEKMSPVDDARYNSGYSTTIQRSGCTPETREKVLEDLKGWVLELQGAKVYWLNGMAGTGKTTILYSLCEWLEENDRLGSNYFCSRISASCRDANNIVPTIAYQLAQHSPTFRSALCKILEERPEATKLDIKWQFEKLIQEPLQAVKTTIPENLVVVIDALDECDDGDAFRLFLGTLLKLAADLPIKFLIASRPEPAIRKKMLAPGSLHSILHLHDIEELIVEGDIKKYLTEALKAMSPSPSPDDVESLVKRAGKLFVYAATALRYIKPGNSVVDSYARFQTVLGMVPGPSKHHDELNRLYTSILSTALDTERLEYQEVNNIRLIVNTVVCAKEPMTIQTLALLLGLPEERVRSSLEPLRSVVHVQDGIQGLVSPFHASFPDYILDQHRSGEFHCETAKHNEVLTNFCFDLMNAQLKFNICRLESSFVFDSDVSDLQKRIKKFISAALSYACQYWGEHLRQGNFTNQVHKRLVHFLTHHLLFWMEILNLQQCLAMGAEMLGLIRNWLKDSRFDTQTQVTDAEAFVTRFAAGECSRSTPHIYISGLPFCPRSNFVYINYWPRTQGLLDVRGSALERWKSTAIGMQKTDSTVLSVSFSPNNTHIVSGSEDRTIQVWDARTGNAIAGPFEGHTKRVLSLEFSPVDGTRIVSGSDDETIRVWDTRTGKTVAGPFIGHKGSVRSVAFSPDGTHIVSGSDDCTTRLWDARTGEPIVEPLTGHTKLVSSVAFSPDGTRIISGSFDKTIRVWDSHTGATVAGPFTGHTAVMSVAFSPDGTRIASGSYNQTIQIWDAHTGMIIAGPFKGHKGSVNSVKFSPNGTRIVSASNDKTLRVWDTITGNTVVGPLKGHTAWVFSVAFSPDGTRAVSGSNDQTIQVWDVNTDNAVAEPLIRHTGCVLSVAFSPDGMHIASGSEDQTIRVWDACTGCLVTGPFKGHTGLVSSVAFSPNNTCIVSGSFDQTLRVWDASTGKIIAGPLKGHTERVLSVAFSPNGAHIVSGSEDHTIRVWDIFTNDTISGPFKGHTASVLSVAFSPDGQRIVSGSNDQTIRVWATFTSNLIAGPFKGAGLICSVAFSPDGAHIASGSGDKTIRVWDASTGDTIAGPFKGHTGRVFSVAFSPDGTRIVSGAVDDTIRLWDARTGDTVAGPFKGHAQSVLSVAFSPDGTRIVSCSNDETIRVWNLSTRDDVAETLADIPANDSRFSHPITGDIFMENFTFTDEGWVTAHDDLLFWISPHFRTQLPFPHNILVISPEGTVMIDYSHLFIGNSWSNCYFS